MRVFFFVAPPHHVLRGGGLFFFFHFRWLASLHFAWADLFFSFIYCLCLAPLCFAWGEVLLICSHFIIIIDSAWALLSGWVIFYYNIFICWTLKCQWGGEQGTLRKSYKKYGRQFCQSKENSNRNSKQKFRNKFRLNRVLKKFENPWTGPLKAPLEAISKRSKFFKILSKRFWQISIQISDSAFNVCNFYPNTGMASPESKFRKKNLSLKHFYSVLRLPKVIKQTIVVVA